MKRHYRPYNFDLNYELKTYNHIGTDYGDAKTANKGLILNLKRSWRKHSNKKEQKYKICHTYSEWEKHIYGILESSTMDKREFLHWLYGKKNDEKEMLDIIKIILIPLYVCLLSLCNVFFGENASQFTKEGGIVICMILIACFSTIEYSKVNRKTNFLDDLIKIVESTVDVNDKPDYDKKI